MRRPAPTEASSLENKEFDVFALFKTPSKKSQEDRRGSPRRAMCLRATLDTGAMVRDCAVVDIAANGARIQLDDALGSDRPCLGQQMLLSPPGQSPIVALLRWSEDRDLGLQFLSPISPDTLTAIERTQQRVVRPRPGRARLTMPAELQVGEARHATRVINLSCGGALIETTTALTPGTMVMIHCDVIRPIAGHVRWSRKNRIGIMFNRLLPVASAEAIAQAFDVSTIWVDEVSTYHSGIDFDRRYEGNRHA